MVEKEQEFKIFSYLNIEQINFEKYVVFKGLKN